MKNEIENMIAAVVSGNKDQAEQLATQIISQKAADRLEYLRQDTISSQFSPQE